MWRCPSWYSKTMRFVFSGRINQSVTNRINQSTVSEECPDSLKFLQPLSKLIVDLLVSYLFLSKIYEGLVFDQLSRNANKILSKLLCGLRKV